MDFLNFDLISFVYSLLGDSLYNLTNNGVHIGIITGSDEDYLREQMGEFLSKSSSRYKTHLMPCNGTKYFKPPQTAEEQHELIYSVDMKSELGKNKFNQLMACIIKQQASGKLDNFPLTGHFIQYRGSMINWCPIGRNATKQDREVFQQFDKNFGISSFRRTVLGQIREEFTNAKLDVNIKLGGETSFDIFPFGWDKTYALRHFPNKTCWFIGDACHEGGNDHEIYEHLKKEGRAFHTSSPTETGEIIRKHILPAIKHL